jgi:hypothetical protein
MALRLAELAGQALGRSVGLGLAVWAWAGSALRDGRVFHPEGELYEGTVEAAGGGLESALGERLAGRALVRLSTGLRRGADAHRDVLGCAIRFRWDPDAPESDAQDLLLVTASHLLTLPLAFLVTDTGSYLANHYHSIARFRTEELGIVQIRAVPHRAPVLGRSTRPVHLARAVAVGRAVFQLEARRSGDGAWRRFARVRLTDRADADDADLLFSPHHAALGLEPVGFLNALRKAPYPASRAGRTLASGVGGAERGRLRHSRSSGRSRRAARLRPV